MSMFSFIERLQRASLAKRMSIAVSFSTVFTLIVFGFWLLTFMRTETSLVATNIPSTLPAHVEQGASPIEAIRHAVGSIFDGSSSVYER